eukprot:jgi/Mesvir1/4095/Mv16057-RA.1
MDLPVIDRIRLRRLGSAFRSCVDDSFLSHKQFLRCDMDGLRDGRFWDTARWLVGKCPNLLAFEFPPELESHESARSDFALPTNPTVSDTLLRMAATCTRLRSLDLGRCASVDDVSIQAIASACHDLTHINIQGTRVSDIGITSLALHCPRLTSLMAGNSVPLVMGCFSASSGMLADVTRGISDTSIALLADNCPLLEKLSLKECPGVTDASISKIAAQCKQLRHLNLRGCAGVTDTSMKILAQENPDLRHLKVKHCRDVTDASVREIATRCPLLLSLNLAGCAAVSDDSITAVAENCPALQRLDLEGCAGVTDGSIQFVGVGLPLLESLVVEGCPLVTDDSVVLTACILTRLKHLRALRTGLSDISLLVLADSCGHSLETLEVSGPGVTDGGVLVVAGRCRRLRYTADRAERAKLLAYGDVGHHRVVPFVLEEFGAMGPLTSAFFKECCRLREDRLDLEGQRAPWSARTWTSYWRQRLSVALTRAMADIMLRRTRADFAVQQGY